MDKDTDVNVERGTAAPGIKTSKTRSAVKLGDAIQRSEKRLQHFRQKRLKFIKEFVGPHYRLPDATDSLVSDPKPEAIPLNTLYSLAQVLMPHISGTTVYASVIAKKLVLRWFANKLRLRCNRVCQEIDLAETFAEVALDALFGVGIVKTGIAPKGAGEFPEPMGYLYDEDEPYVKAVDLDDYILDPDCRKRTEANKEGNFYTVPVEWAYDCDLYPHELLDKMDATHIEPTRAEGKVEDVSKEGAGSQGDRFVEYFRFADLWVPHTNMILTVPGRVDQISDYLAEQEYEGPERGPYDMLGFLYPPGNAMPIAPMDAIFDIHKLLNELAKKIYRQAKRSKVLGLYTLGAVKDGETIRESADGTMAGVTDVNAVKEVKFGGVDSNDYLVPNWFQVWQNRIGGNPDLLGGQKAQSETLGQDVMLMQNATGRVNSMAMQVRKFAQRILRKVAWYVWTDDRTDQELVLDVEGFQIPQRWQKDVREGDFIDYGFDIESYTLAPDTPQQRYERTIGLIERVMTPMAQQMAMQGVFIDVESLVKSLADDVNIPNIGAWFKTQEPALLPGGAGSPGAPRAAVSQPNMTVRPTAPQTQQPEPTA